MEVISVLLKNILICGNLYFLCVEMLKGRNHEYLFSESANLLCFGFVLLSVSLYGIKYGVGNIISF